MSRFEETSSFRGNRTVHCDVLKQILSALSSDQLKTRRKPITSPKLIWKMMNKQSSAGYPYHKQKKNYYPIVEKICSDVINGTVDMEIFTRPCVTHRVLQPGDGQIKNRWIYCVPIEVTVIEMIFGLDIIFDFQRKPNCPIKLGSTQVELHQYIQRNKKGKKSAAGDYSKFDSTIPKWLMYCAFHIIKHMLDLNDYESKLFDVMAMYIIECNIYHPHTGFTKRGRGLISGSFYTNLIDSICNWYIIEYSFNCCSKQNRRNSFSYSVSGDDSVFFYDILDFNCMKERV